VGTCSRTPISFRACNKNKVNDELKISSDQSFLCPFEIIEHNHLTELIFGKFGELMIKSVQSRLRDKGINLSVDLLVQAFDGL
jgi:hypothetical protein